MRRALIALAGALLLALIGMQLLLPAYLEGRIEDRLTEHGGRADASLEAIPALRLAASDGERLTIDGSGLTVDPEQEERVFEKLDGFDEVEVRLRDVRAGPFEVRSFELTRAESARTYQVELAGSTSGRELARYVTSNLPFGGLLGGLAATALPASDVPVPMEIDAEVESDDGRARVVRAEGSVAGLPAGPFAELVVGLVVSRL